MHTVAVLPRQIKMVKQFCNQQLPIPVPNGHDNGHVRNII